MTASAEPFGLTRPAAPPANRTYWTAAEVDPQLNWGRDEAGNLVPDAQARTIKLAFDKLGNNSRMGSGPSTLIRVKR